MSIEYSDIFGKLTLDALKHDMIEASVGIGIILGSIAISAYLTYYKRWTWLWTEWLTSLDHKKIGVMYIVVTALMLFKGLVDAAMMRAQQAFIGGRFVWLFIDPPFSTAFYSPRRRR